MGGKENQTTNEEVVAKRKEKNSPSKYRIKYNCQLLHIKTKNNQHCGLSREC